MKINTIIFNNTLACICFIASGFIWAQDIHFSHVEFSPLTLNPANAGVNSPLQGIANYRKQWGSIDSPFQTIAATFDGRINEKNRQRRGILAAGLNLFSDQAGDLKVSTNTVNLSLGYHLLIDKKSTIGIGINTGFGQRVFDPNNGRWSNQYDGTNYNSSILSGETFGASSFTYWDAGTGVVYNYKKNQGYMTQNNQRAITTGFAVYHLNKPGYSFVNKQDDRLYMRTTFFVNGTFGISNTRGTFLPGIYINRQKKQNEIMFGTYYRYLLQEGSNFTGFNKPMFFYLGAFYRMQDAMIGRAMLEYDQYSVGFAYDINLSSLKAVSKTKGGFELFLKYTMTPGGASRSRI